MKVTALLGPPGAGKGTLAAALAECADYAVFVTGDVLRAEIASGSELGSKVRADVESGRLVADEVILALVKSFLARNPGGVLFDGFPRTLDQAQGLRQALGNGDELKVIYLDTSQETILARLTARRVCPQCGRIYNLHFRPPQDGTTCDDCKVELIQRVDDTAEVIKHRCNTYLEQTSPLIEYFSDELCKVNGNLSGEEVLEILRGEFCQG